MPDFKEENRLQRKKFIVIGVDEVGRGAWAGPVVAAAVLIELKIKNEKLRNWEKLGIDDSKRLSPQKRQELAKIIKRNAVWGVGEVGVAFINKHGIVKATEKAMRAAIADTVRKYQIKVVGSEMKDRITEKRAKKKGQNLTTDFQFPGSKLLSHYSLPLSRFFVLLDAFHVKYIPGVGLKNQKAIMKGDQKSISIAAASIVAKVHRDKLMVKLGKKYPQYGWKQNKGYGTKKHQQAVRTLGATRLHRKLFVRKYLIVCYVDYLYWKRQRENDSGFGTGASGGRVGKASLHSSICQRRILARRGEAEFKKEFK